MPKCQKCELLLELYQRTPQKPRDYWIMTELFVELHGFDHCDMGIPNADSMDELAEWEEQALLRSFLENQAEKLGCTLELAAKLNTLQSNIESLQRERGDPC